MSTTVNALPVELLLQVFSYIAHPEPCDRRMCATLKNRHWAHLMLVCARWRAIIVEATPLWTAIDFSDNINWVEICLERSRRAPIDIRLVGLCFPTLKRALQHAIAAASRIRSFTLQSYVKMISPMIQRLFDTPLPALENLTISLTRPGGGWAQVDLGLSTRKELRLRSLDLTGLPIPLDLELYSRMTSLALHHGSTPRAGLTFEHLMRILRKAAPHLRDLDLSQLQLPPTPAGQSDHVYTPLLLPKVWSYYMNCDHATASRVLQALELPACTHFHLRVEIQQSRNGPSFRSDLLKLIPQNIRPILDNTTELAITMTANRYTIRDPGPRNARAEHCGDTWHTDRVQMAIVGGVEPELSDIAHVASLAHLTTLTLTLDRTCNSLATTAQWEALLSACASLETLDVDSDGQAACLFLALTPSTTTAPVLCPFLRVLSIALHNMRHGREGALMCLQAREGRASRLSSLTLKGCLGFGDDINLLPWMQQLHSLVYELIMVA